MKLKQGMRILFQGDSITDACRDRSDRHSLAGYNALIGESLSVRGIECFNRGISGDRTTETLPRMQADLDDTNPDLVSILLGINDTWRRFDSNLVTTSEQFEDKYRKILEIAKSKVNQIVILEPFLLPVDSQKACFRSDLDEKIHVVRKLAREYATDFLPLDGLFAEACVHMDPKQLSDDGVHPNDGGNKFIAQHFLGRIEIL